MTKRKMIFTKKSLLVLILCGFIFSAIGQTSNRKFSLATKLGLFQDIHKVDFDSGGALIKSPYRWNGFPGDAIFTVGLESQKENRLLKFQISYHDYYNFIGRVNTYDNLPEASTGSELEVLDIIIMTGRKFDLAKKRISFSPSIGGGVGLFLFFDKNDSSIGSSFSGISRDGIVLYSWESTHEVTHNAENNFYLAFGLDIDFNINPYLTLFISTDYIIGLRKIFEVDVNYSVNSEPEQIGRLKTSGSYFSLSAGLKIPLNWIWK